MSFQSVWRGWRARVHDILEVGAGDPTGRVVNVFLITLIIANGLAFAAETVSSVYERWGPELEAFNIFSVIVFTSNMCSGCGARWRFLCIAACRIGGRG